MKIVLDFLGRIKDCFGSSLKAGRRALSSPSDSQGKKHNAMSKPTTNKQKEAASSIEAQTVLSFERALVGFAPYDEAVSLLNEGVKAGKVTPERQKEWKTLVGSPIPAAPHTSTSLFCLLAAKWGGKVLPAKAAELTRLGRKGEQGEQIRLLLIQYFPIHGMVELVKKSGFNADFYQAVLRYHAPVDGESDVHEWERLKSLLSLTSFNSSAVSQAAKAEGHLLFFEGQQVEIPTAEKGAKAEAKKEESKDLSSF